MDLRRWLYFSSPIKDENENVDCVTFDEPCPPQCHFYCVVNSQYFPLPPPPPPPTPSGSSYHHISIILIIVCILASAFLVLTYYKIFKAYCIRRFFAASRSSPPQIDTVHHDDHDDHDENHDPIHYIWYLSTRGLNESVINSITVCKYKNGDGLIDGTECSVCLTEFQEDEDLRLLPKCNHAFHLPCIDRWLRSHVNCPLCRANIVSNPVSAEISSSSVVADETLAGNPQGNIGSVSDRSDVFVGVQSADGTELEGLQDERRNLDLESAKMGPFPVLDSGFRVQSDLAQNHRLGENGVEMMTEDGIQPVRRSVSMDSSAAAMISLSLAHLVPSGSEGSSSAMVVKPSGPKRIVPKHGRNPSFFKLMASCSKGPFPQKGPVPMKRSFSAGKFLLSRHSRSRNSVLPL